MNIIKYAHRHVQQANIHRNNNTPLREAEDISQQYKTFAAENSLTHWDSFKVRKQVNLKTMEAPAVRVSLRLEDGSLVNFKPISTKFFSLIPPNEMANDLSFWGMRSFPFINAWGMTSPSALYWDTFTKNSKYFQDMSEEEYEQSHRDFLDEYQRAFEEIRNTLGRSIGFMVNAALGKGLATALTSDHEIDTELGERLHQGELPFILEATIFDQGKTRPESTQAKPYKESIELTDEQQDLKNLIIRELNAIPDIKDPNLKRKIANNVVYKFFAEG